MGNRIAILMNGAMRIPISSIEGCVKNTLSLVSEYDHDLYFFTWQTDEGYEYSFDKHVDYLITDVEPDVRFLDDHGWPVVSNHKKLNKKDQDNHRLGQYATLHGIQQMFYEIENNQREYDYVLRIRNDLLLKTDFHKWVKRATNDNTVITADGNPTAFMNDHVAFGTYQAIRDVYYYVGYDIWKRAIGASKSFPQANKKIIKDQGKSIQQVKTHKYVIKRNGWDWTLV